MNRVAAFGSGNRGPLTTTLTSSYPTSTEAISFTMPSTSAASSSSSGTSVPVHPSLASAPTSTSQAGNAAEVIPQHPLQPMLKSIIDELRRTYHEVKKVQDEQKKINATLVQMTAASFSIESSPYKVSYPFTLQYTP